MMEKWTREQLQHYQRTGEEPTGRKAPKGAKQIRLAGQKPHPLEALLDDLALDGWPAPEAEHQFHQVRRWRLDRAWKSAKVGIEYNGIMGAKNASHASVSQLLRDYEKATEAQLLGWVVVVVTVKTIQNGKALAWIRRALEMRGVKRADTARRTNKPTNTRKTIS